MRWKTKKFKSTEPDEIYRMYLKNVKVISESLGSVFKKSLESGEVPIL